MTQFVIILLGLLLQPPGPTPEDLAKCADCHEGFDDDTKPGMHTASAGCLSCHFPHEIKDGKIVPPHPPTKEKCLECHDDVVESAPHPMKGKLSPEQLKAFGEKKAVDLNCMACHTLHHAKSETLLSKPIQESQLCIACHSGFTGVVGGVHDLRQSAPAEKNQGGKTASDSGPCSACHTVHAAARPILKNDIDTDGTCITCHRDDGPASRYTGQPFVHPTAISCGTCHDPHESATRSPNLLKLSDDTGATGVCLDCHTEMANVRRSLHNRACINRAGTETDCGACHAIHGPTREWKGGTWIGPVNAHAPPEIRACTGCHSTVGGQRDVPFRKHPTLDMTEFQKPTDPGFLPLVDGAGKSGPAGVIGCLTCHIPHGRDESASFKYPGLDTASGVVPLRSARPMVRPFVTPNLCTACHGPEALPRFLYFHRPH